MDIASLAGLAGGIVMFLYGIISSGSPLNNFMDYPSVIITVGGSLTSTLTSLKMPDFINGLKSSMKMAIKEPPNSDAKEIINRILEMANTARKEGLLSLEETANNIEDDFMKRGVMLVVDGTDADLVRAILENDIDAMCSRHKKVKTFLDTWGAQGPAWGMIGTLIGLVNMLQNLSDASAIGPAMAVALLTTLYGSLIANWFTTPCGNKLDVDTDIEVQTKTIIVEGLLSIQAGENPHVIEEKLKTFLAPSDREGIGTGETGGEG